MTVMDIGQEVTIVIPMTRRWWEFWKPKRWTERQSAVVVKTATSTPALPNLEWVTPHSAAASPWNPPA